MERRMGSCMLRGSIHGDWGWMDLESVGLTEL